MDLPSPGAAFHFIPGRRRRGRRIFLLPDAFHYRALLPGILLTFLYSAPKLPQKIFRGLRRIAIGKTLYLAFVWVYVTTVLPIIVAGARWHPSFIFFTASRFFFVYACCLIFDYRDREDDRTAGIVSADDHPAE